MASSPPLTDGSFLSLLDHRDAGGHGCHLLRQQVSCEVQETQETGSWHKKVDSIGEGEDGSSRWVGEAAWESRWVGEAGYDSSTRAAVVSFSESPPPPPPLLLLLVLPAAAPATILTHY
jgi:hypothetical protein